MNADIVTAGALFGAWLICLTNTSALLRDRDAKGVRPYSNIYFVASNSWITWQFFCLGQTATGAVSLLLVALNAINAALIIRYRGMQW